MKMNMRDTLRGNLTVRLNNIETLRIDRLYNYT